MFKTLLWASFFFVKFLLVDGVAFDSKLCPITSKSSFFTTSKNYHMYPLEIYDNRTYSQILNKDRSFSKCNAVDENILSVHLPPTKINYTSCPEPIVEFECPIKPGLLFQMTNKSNEWIDAGYFSNFFYHLQNASETINFIVVGTSVTSGVLSQGCCADEECNRDAEDKNTQFNEAGGTRSCSWTHHFGAWLTLFSKAKVNVYNLARPGISSDSVNGYIVSSLHSHGLSSLSDRDLIFMDFAVNDNAFHASKAHQMVLIKGLENMIQHFVSQSDGRSVPSLVLLDTDQRNAPLVPAAYEKVARYYKIPFWSLRDAIQLGFPSNFTAKEHLYMEHLAFYSNKGRRSQAHIPWHVHLFLAEVIAATMHSVLRETAVVMKSNHYQEKQFQLPPLLTTLDRSACDSSSEIMHIDHVDIEEKQPILGQFVIYAVLTVLLIVVTGSYHFSDHKNGWKLGVDVRGRGGFIRQLNDTDSCGAENYAEIRFQANRTNAEMMRDKAQRYTVVLDYLKSYTNTGVVQFYVCNKLHGQLTSFWDDWKEFKFSFPRSTFLDILPASFCEAALVAPNDPFEVKLRHIPQCGAGQEVAATQPPYGPHQMFKVTAISMCML